MATSSARCGDEEFKDPSERAAFELVPQYLANGVAAEPYDRCGRQSAVDFLLHDPDGRTAALEVTSDAAAGMRQLYVLLAGEFQTLPNPGNWTWHAAVGDPRDLPQLAERSSRIIVFCEAAGIAEPKYADHLLDENAYITWLIESSASLHGTPDQPKMSGDREHPLYVTLNAEGGFLNESLSRFATAIEELLARRHVQHRVEKLAKSGFAEQHLFVHLDNSALPFDVFTRWRPATPCPRSLQRCLET